MKSILQHLVSLILPLTVLVIVPALFEKHPIVSSGALLALGLLLLIAGLYMMVQTISGFARIGKGTLAPWSPPQHLVVAGMYRYVRNPMILGVIIVLLGEAAVVMSPAILLWAVAVFMINTVYFIFSEEPGLEQRFGEEYRGYKRNVPRWIPRLRPWKPGRGQREQ